MIPDNVKKIFNENLWYIATCGDEPNVVPVGFKRVCDDGKLAIGAVLLETTLKNIRSNGRIAVACANPVTGEAYKIKGIAELVYEGEPLNAGKIAELTGLDRKVVDKTMAAMKKEGSIVSPIRCKWEPAEK